MRGRCLSLSWRRRGCCCWASHGLAERLPLNARSPRSVRAVHTRCGALSPLPSPLPTATFPFDLSPSSLRILFFGSDAFSLPTLQLLTSPSPSPSTAPRVVVVCPPNQLQGRYRPRIPTAVRSYAEEVGLPVFPVSGAVDFRMRGWERPDCPSTGEFDVGVVVSFGYFLPLRLIQSFPLGMINLHPSLLPKYRGASPIQHSLLHNEHITGVSVIDLHPTTMDAGDILLQITEVTSSHPPPSHPPPTLLIPLPSLTPLLSLQSIAPDDTYDTLAPRLSILGSHAILHSLNHLSSLRKNAIPQSLPSTSSPSAPKLRNTFGHLDLTLPALTVYHRYRACKGFLPLYTSYQQQRINLIHIDGVDPSVRSELRAGDVTWDRGTKRLRVQCGDGRGLWVTAVQMANKKITEAAAFANGHLLNVTAKGRQTGETTVRFGDVEAAATAPALATAVA